MADAVFRPMSTELNYLLYASVLGILQILVAAQAMTSAMGIKYNMGPRDGNPPELPVFAARLSRAYKNFLETFAFFAAAVLMVYVTGRSTPLSVLGAELYFFARVVYLPLYAAGVPGLRTLAWLASLVGIVLIVIPLF